MTKNKSEKLFVVTLQVVTYYKTTPPLAGHPSFEGGELG